LEQIIGSELGVRKVINNLTIKSLEVLKGEIREEVQEALNKVIEFDNIEFQSNTAIILDESFNLLDETAVILNENSDLSIEIGGHSDSAGNEDYNIGLSQRRADAVLIALVNRGVERSRLLAVGYGSSQNIAENNTDEGKQKNRRVEFKIKEDM
jgi:outer membrane protein OmpA-like peptidoglycan-associated protein